MTLLEHRSGAQFTPPPKRHPAAMPAIVGVEMWERFSFYGMQAILVFYLYASDGLGLSKTDATAILGAYGAFVYLCTIAGGWVGDRLLGPERTLLTGCVLLMTGHVALSAIPGIAGTTIGLLCIGIGSGFLKTSAITVLGAVYSLRDAASKQLKDAGFQLFYLGIQLGAMFGPILTGYLAERYNWHVGFAAAAALMAIGLVNYVALRPRILEALPDDSRSRVTAPVARASRRQLVRISSLLIATVLILGILALSGILNPSRLSSLLLTVVVLSSVVLFVSMLRSAEVTAEERTKLWSFLPLFLASSVFWSVAYQNFGVFAVYSDVRLDRMLGGFEIPPAWTQTLNPISVLALSLPMALLWNKMGTRQPSTPTKMAIGVILSGLAFLLFLPFTEGGEGSTPLWVLVLIALVIAVGELMIGPIGMAATAHYAPRACATRFSAFFFLTFAIGMAASGQLSTFYNPESSAAEFSYFLTTGLVTILLGIGLWWWADRARRSSRTAS